jgi:hypothetical protein
MSKKTATNANGTQLFRPKQNYKNNTQTEEKEKKKREPRMPTKGGVRIGDNQD